MLETPKFTAGHPLRQFSGNEVGSMTIMGLFIFLIMAVVGAIGLDVAKLMSARNQLQIAADTAAHTALYQRNLNSASHAKNQAILIAQKNMPTAAYGNVLTESDIEFGSFDYDSWTFTADSSLSSAVRVTTNRLGSRSNSVGSLLFQLVGMSDWDIVTPSIYATYNPDCLSEGLFGDQSVDMQSNNTFTNGFTICSNGFVKVGSGNIFEGGTAVMMPDLADLVMPTSGFDSNAGLENALYPGGYKPLILYRLEELILSFMNGTYNSLPYTDPKTYLVSMTPVILSGGGAVTELDLLPGYIYMKTCTGGTPLQLKLSSPGAAISEIVLVTNCRITMPAKVNLEDAVIGTLNSSANSISTAADFQIGRDDNCAAGGGSQVLSMGGVSIGAQLYMFGGQIIAWGDIDFAAEADGIQGASMISGGDVNGTSNISMAFCGSGMGGNFEVDYFRMAG